MHWTPSICEKVPCLKTVQVLGCLPVEHDCLKELQLTRIYVSAFIFKDLE